MNMIFNDIEITEDDIRYAEEILFDKVNIFDEQERIPIIQDFNNSFDVNACPGSGKTTVLLAKLIILSRKMPLNNGQGICVLTHTNVAIDEIKSKLGDKSDILFKYPNYFGTIQNFVDKYLAIPYFKRQKNENIKSIDDDIYYDNIKKLSKEVYPNIDSIIQFCIEKGYGNYTCDSHERNFMTFIANKHFNIDNNDIRDNYNKVLTDKFYYSELKDIMLNKTLDNGILRYEDAYFLAGLYIKKFPDIKKYFSNRFKYVFIDEMQDVSKIQMKIIGNIFNDDKVIIQRFGDINQSISKFDSNNNNWIFNEELKTINSSKRYGDGVVKFLEPLRVEKFGEFKGNEDIDTLNPHIIIFDDPEIESVIPKYLELLDKYNIKEEKNKRIKVIGKLALSVSNPYKSISSYVRGYNSKGNRDIPLHKKVINKLNRVKTTKEFYDYLISVILLAIDIDGRKVSNEEFTRLMEDKYINEFTIYRSNILKWTKNFRENTSLVLEDILDKTQSLFSEVEEVNCNNDILKNKINSNTGEVEESQEYLEAIELVISMDNIDTIMSTKGETHKATLYLESKLVYSNGDDRSDISRILDYMVNKKEEVDDGDKEALMNAYVAMSRAEKLTCIAIQYETIKGRIKEFKEYGYEVIGCNTEIDVLISNELQEL
ncbi:uvrD/REP helicase N-terminal domain protein [[Clostridium] bifermentans ATCC 638]|uniref:UvrD/REP helicase N-terminal domain protein n=1 Tax=Paraclostridium bifermentans ATCC 638 = DSM 14991 TaxID=1233171 RepID=T4VPS1_PARBF|nr:UvrD-helicase domain-containing protein [Paraclostridium bifermentans]EQK42667.1 uvrD/REP helicase N-terminal domain protein [[Clostridium] bifermentans ATCC 638] [Paraclostridium bifermentans ATCC 638 = DSM 14991]RIZ58355.1 ATP-dependent helicase [Paraclostridium bifermentans]UAG19471.1 UvrD-helicase domain-containing protein [Paraclostridium bifermentans]